MFGAWDTEKMIIEGRCLGIFIMGVDCEKYVQRVLMMINFINSGYPRWPNIKKTLNSKLYIKPK